MGAALTKRLRAMSRPELVAGIAIALIVSGLALRFLGPTIVLPIVTLLRSLSDQTLTLVVQGFGLLEIVVGIALLAWVAKHIRHRAAHAPSANNEVPQP